MKSLELTRPQATELAQRLKKPCRFIQSISGAKQKRKVALLILGEVQKFPHWSAIVKYLWDEDSRMKRMVAAKCLFRFPDWTFFAKYSKLLSS